MSASGQFPASGPDDWVEHIREALKDAPPPTDDAIFESAYDASEVETAKIFDYFEGRLGEEERKHLEAEAAASPHALKKLARIGAIVAQNRRGSLR